MNTEMNTPDEPEAARPETEASTGHDVPTDRRPFGFWLKVIDRRLSDEMEALFAADGITRRDWRMLNLLADEAEDERLARRLHAKPHVFHRLAERGWVAGFPPELTDAGRDARERLETQVTALRQRVAGAVSPEDFATTLRTLEAIARELGWDESQPLPRGGRGGRRFGARMHEHHEDDERLGQRRGFGPGHGFGRGHHRGRASQHDVHVHVHVHDGHGYRHGG